MGAEDTWLVLGDDAMGNRLPATKLRAIVSWIHVTIVLDSIRDFLKRVAASVDAEYAEVIGQAEAGELSDSDELEEALFSPMKSEDIAVWAALGELNAFVEWELQGLATQPFSEAEARKKHKPTKPRRSVMDCGRSELYTLIEAHYGLKLADIPCADAVDEIRRMVNAHKHRQNWKHPFRDYPSTAGTDPSQYLERFEVDRQHAFGLIEAARKFLKELSRATRKDYSLRSRLEEGEFDLFQEDEGREPRR